MDITMFLLRTTEYGDDALRASRNLMTSVPLAPTREEDEGLRSLHGVRGRAHRWMFSQVFRDPHPELGFGS